MLKNNKLILNLFSLISGATLVLAFAPIHWFFLAFLCPAVLLYIWLQSNQRAAFWYGFLFGLGFYTAGVSWVFISIHHYGNANISISLLITSMLILLMSCYPAVMGYIMRRFWKNKSNAMLCCAAFPALWVSFEWLRAWLFSGFPWILLGYSQSNFVLKNLASMLSVYGVSLACAFFSGLIILFFITKKNRTRMIAVFSIIVICLVSWGLGFIQWTKPFRQPIQVSLIQGNIPINLKWNNDYLSHILQVYSTETKKHWNSQIILWPEAAVPTLTHPISQQLYRLSQLAKKHHSTIIFGIPTYNQRNGNFYNSIKVIGSGKGRYNKRHLVPYGEYTPLAFIFKPLMKQLNIPMSGFTAGRYDQPPLAVQHLKISPFICYEIIFPHEVIRFARGSNLIVTLSDDSWFGNSFASPQQLQMAQMRAIETGRPILYSTNNGITAIINSQGQITKAIPTNQRTTLTADVQPMQGNTPVMKLHNLLVGALVILLLFTSKL